MYNLCFSPPDNLTPFSPINVSNLLGAKDKGYRALTNIGSDGGQEVPHLHFHLFGGEKVGKMVS